MFWGITLESGKKYTQVLERSFHVTMAALGFSSANPDPVSVLVDINQAQYVLCTLQAGKIPQQTLSLKFTEGEEVSFSIEGDGEVHLTGYLQPDPQEYEFSSGDEDSEVFDQGDISDDEFLSTKTNLKSKNEGKDNNCEAKENGEDNTTIVVSPEISIEHIPKKTYKAKKGKQENEVKNDTVSPSPKKSKLKIVSKSNTEQFPEQFKKGSKSDLSPVKSKSKLKINNEEETEDADNIEENVKIENGISEQESVSIKKSSKKKTKKRKQIIDNNNDNTEVVNDEAVLDDINNNKKDEVVVETTVNEEETTLSKRKRKKRK